MKSIVIRIASFFVCAPMLTAAVSACASQPPPQCDKPGQWPSNMAFVYLKNLGVATNESVAFSKTQVSSIASQQINDSTYRQVHLVTFAELDGNIIEIITISDATIEECSMGDVDVYRVERLSP